jgi:hypothetical protein
MPVETISGAGRTSKPEAGTTAASLGTAPTWAKISAVIAMALFFADEEEGEGKIKGRPGAAAEKTKEADILTHKLSGTAESRLTLRRTAYSLFIRLHEYRFWAALCQARFDYWLSL